MTEHPKVVTHLVAGNWTRGECGEEGFPPPIHLTTVLDKIDCHACRQSPEFQARMQRAMPARERRE